MALNLLLQVLVAYFVCPFLLRLARMWAVLLMKVSGPSSEKLTHIYYVFGDFVREIVVIATRQEVFGMYPYDPCTVWCIYLHLP